LQAIPNGAVSKLNTSWTLCSYRTVSIWTISATASSQKLNVMEVSRYEGQGALPSHS
jgi:hypothetical protein